MGLLDITMIGIGAMVGAGIFVLTGIAAGKAGPALIIAFALNGVSAMFTALAYAELGSCFPQAGGGYQWVAEAFPGRMAFLTGWISWLANSVACSDRGRACATSLRRSSAVWKGHFLMCCVGALGTWSRRTPAWRLR